ncbi:MAG: hypothetical protein IJ658_06030 [Kiritimatiellae bacterium]|nr:hypothetical protein [Kiritimatiellia bacterium]
MAEETTRFDPKIEEGIAYFEKMLQLKPDDRVTLQFLCVAYGQIGESDKQRRALVSLAGALLKEKDFEAAEKLVEKLENYTEPDARAAILRIRAANRPKKAAEAAQAAAAPAPGSKTTTAVYIAIKAEKKLARHLAERKVIGEAEADAIQDRLTALADVPGCFLVSTLAEIEKEDTAAAEAAVASLADETGVPPIPLEAYNIGSDLAQALPDSIVRVRGVLPFAKLGDTLLVATLNPFDDDLRQHVESDAGAPCRFFLANPRTMETTLDRIFADEPLATQNGDAPREA